MTLEVFPVKTPPVNMFTGIIETIGRVRSFERKEDFAGISVQAELSNSDIKIGDSVAINGVCLTVTSVAGNAFTADVGLETLKVTALKGLHEGSFVNVERAMQMGGRLGGHLVQGHVDGVGKISRINELEGGVEVVCEAPEALSRYVVNKGSICMNGVSLTVAECHQNTFKVFLIPHTIASTIFKYMKVGDALNLEVDIIGKYVEKLTHLKSDAEQQPSKITEEFLRKHGF